MLYVAYSAYIVLTAWAIVRWKTTTAAGDGRTYYVISGCMAILPALVASTSSILLREDLVGATWPLSLFLSGAMLLLAGLMLNFLNPSRRHVSLRLAGWSLLSGVLLIPASIALLAPVAGLLAFLVPERYASPAVQLNDR